MMLTNVTFIQTTDDNVLHLDVNAWHPKLDDQLHPCWDVYSVRF